MCVVSMVMDQGYRDYPWHRPGITPWQTCPDNSEKDNSATNKLLAELLNSQLRQAAEYDKKNNQPHCPDAEKKVKLLKLANELGVRIEFPDETVALSSGH